MSGMADESRPLRAFAPALGLLAILGVINFIDRSNLSIADPLLHNDFLPFFGISGPAILAARAISKSAGPYFYFTG